MTPGRPVPLSSLKSGGARPSGRLPFPVPARRARGVPEHTGTSCDLAANSSLPKAPPAPPPRILPLTASMHCVRWSSTGSRGEPASRCPAAFSQSMRTATSAPGRALAAQAGMAIGEDDSRTTRAWCGSWSTERSRSPFPPSACWCAAVRQGKLRRRGPVALDAQRRTGAIRLPWGRCGGRGATGRKPSRPRPERPLSVSGPRHWNQAAVAHVSRADPVEIARIGRPFRETGEDGGQSGASPEGADASGVAGGVDEIGYLPVHQEGAILFFQLINATRGHRRGAWWTARFVWPARGRISARRAQASAIATRRAEYPCCQRRGRRGAVRPAASSRYAAPPLRSGPAGDPAGRTARRLVMTGRELPVITDRLLRALVGSPRQSGGTTADPARAARWPVATTCA